MTYDNWKTTEPEIFKDYPPVESAAEPRRIRCFACNGLGVDEWGEVCIVCGGEGDVEDDSQDDPNQEVWQTERRS